MNGDEMADVFGDRGPKENAVGNGSSSLPNLLVHASNGVDYAYRDAGAGELPLVLLQHSRGNLGNWDPALVDEVAATRRVLAFDNAGVGDSSGTTPHRIHRMAHDAIQFIASLDLPQVDLLGFRRRRSPSSARTWYVA